MRITEKDRLDLRRELERIFINPRFAEIAMAAMPPIDYDTFATRDDLDTLRVALSADVTAMGAELRVEMADLRTEMADLRTEIATQGADLRGTLVSHMRLTFLMQIVTFTAIITYLNAAL